MEGGRSYSVFFILRAPHRLQLAVSSRPHHSSAREKKALAAWTCVRTPSRARRPARHARSHTCTHFKARLALTPLALFAPPLAVQPADIGARFRAGPPTPTTRRSRCFLQERGGQRCDGGGEGDVRTRSGLAQTSETHLARGVGLHAGRCATLTPPLIASLPGRSADSSLARCRPGRSRHRSFLCRTTLCKSWRLLWTRTTCLHSP